MATNQTARRAKGVAPQATLPVITADDVRAQQASGGLSSVEIYPLAEPTPASGPSAIRQRTTADSGSGATTDADAPQRPRSTQAPVARYSFTLPGKLIVTVTGAGVIGRGPDAAVGTQVITIDDPGRSLSRSHLGFELDARGRLLVVDLHSANGSEIVTASSERIVCVPGKRYPVDAGATLLLGDYSVAVELS